MSSLVYPLNITNGSLEVTDDYPKIVGGAILSSLKTRTEERVFRPEYGREDEEFNTVSNLTDVLARVRLAVELGLETYDGVVFEVRGRLLDDGLVDIAIVYQCPDSLENTIEIVL